MFSLTTHTLPDKNVVTTRGVGSVLVLTESAASGAFGPLAGGRVDAVSGLAASDFETPNDVLS